MSEAKDLRFIGREFHKRREELLLLLFVFILSQLQNDRSANLSLVETGGMERHR